MLYTVIIITIAWLKPLLGQLFKKWLKHGNKIFRSADPKDFINMIVLLSFVIERNWYKNHKFLFKVILDYSKCSHTPEAMCHQQHFAVFPSADLLDDVEVLLDLQVTEALSRKLHQLIDQAAISEAQLNHLYLHTDRKLKKKKKEKYGFRGRHTFEHTQLLDFHKVHAYWNIRCKYIYIYMICICTIETGFLYQISFLANRTNYLFQLSVMLHLYKRAQNLNYVKKYLVTNSSNLKLAGLIQNCLLDCWIALCMKISISLWKMPIRYSHSYWSLFTWKTECNTMYVFENVRRVPHI